MSRWQVEALKEIPWESDEIGSHAIENSHYLTDIHATILHQMGLDGGSMEVTGVSGSKKITDTLYPISYPENSKELIP